MAGALGSRLAARRDEALGRRVGDDLVDELAHVCAQRRVVPGCAVRSERPPDYGCGQQDIWGDDEDVVRWKTMTTEFWTQAATHVAPFPVALYPMGVGLADWI